MTRPTPVPTVRIVYLRSGAILLTKKSYRGWEKIAGDYPEYVPSVGPLAKEEVVRFFAGDLGPDDTEWPFSRAAIAAFFAADDTVLTCPQSEG
jgi:hypothetical protein